MARPSLCAALGSAFRCIVADPPWDVKAGPAGAGYILNDDGVQSWDNVSRPSRDLPYKSLSVDQIAALPVERLADTAAHLYLWTINRYVEDAYRVARSWGFAPSTLLVRARARWVGDWEEPTASLPSCPVLPARNTRSKGTNHGDMVQLEATVQQ